jgi:nucleoside-diphosphate-sugar epimerase
MVLYRFGADVMGISTFKPSKPGIFIETELKDIIKSYIGEINDVNSFVQILGDFEPEIIFYLTPTSIITNKTDFSEIYSMNIRNILNVLEYCKNFKHIQLFVNLIPGIPPVSFFDDKLKRSGELELIRGSFLTTEFLTTGYRKAYTQGTSYLNILSPEIIGGGDWSDLSLINLFINTAKGKLKQINASDEITHKMIHVLDLIRGVLDITRIKVSEGDSFKDDIRLFNDENNLFNESQIAQIFKELWDDEELIIKEKETDSTFPEFKMYFGEYCNIEGLSPMISGRLAVELCIIWNRARDKGADMRRYSFRQIDEFFNNIVHDKV